MQDPFRPYADYLRPEFDMEDRVRQLYIQFEETPNPSMMLYFYENFEDYWQCACGSQNDHGQKFCGHCGVRHDWLSAHCSDLVLAARLTERKGPDSVRWYTDRTIRVRSPWREGTPVELAPDRVMDTWYRGDEADEPEPPITPPARAHFTNDVSQDTMLFREGELEATRLIPVLQEPDRLFGVREEAQIKASREHTPQVDQPAVDTQTDEPAPDADDRFKPEPVEPEPPMDPPIVHSVPEVSKRPAAVVYHGTRQAPAKPTLEKPRATVRPIMHHRANVAPFPVKAEHEEDLAIPPRPEAVAPSDQATQTPADDPAHAPAPTRPKRAPSPEPFAFPRVNDLWATIIAGVLILLLLFYVIRPSAAPTTEPTRGPATPPPQTTTTADR